MKVYRRVLNIVVVVAMAAMMVGCAARPKNISNRGLVSLFKEFLLVNAYATDVLYLSARDSVDLYTPVLEKHGYTIEDFEYTIDNLTKRKSAQISDIMEVAISELKLEADERRILWNYWSKMIDNGKELAMDTIVVDSLLDSKKIGEKGMRLYFEDLKPGSYRIDYNYFITARTYGERVYAELRDVADSTHTINQWSLRVDDTVKGSHPFTITKPTERVYVVWRNRGNDTKALQMWVDSLKLTYEPADTIAVRLMEEQMRYNTDYTTPEEIVGQYLLTAEALDKILAEEKAAAESETSSDQPAEE